MLTDLISQIVTYIRESYFLSLFICSLTVSTIFLIIEVLYLLLFPKNRYYYKGVEVKKLEDSM